MARPLPPFAGSCLCGAVRIIVTAPALLTLACHCRDCQKLTASAYSLTTMFPSGGFSYSGDVITGGRGAGGRRHFFCKSCLNFVYSQIEGAEQRINLRTSLLDDAASFVPFVEVMTREKMPWAEVPAAHRYSGYPASTDDLQALMESYANQ